MLKFRLFPVLFLAMSFAGCSGTLFQAPPRIDPLADIMPTRKNESAVTEITEAKKKGLAVIVSTSTTTQFKAKKEADERLVQLNKGEIFNNLRSRMSALTATVAPEKIVQVLISDFRKSFKSVTVINDFTEFSSSNSDFAVVVDIGLGGDLRYGIGSVQGDFQTDIDLYFFDQKFNQFLIIKGTGKSSDKASTDFATEVLRAYAEVVSFGTISPTEQQRQDEYLDLHRKAYQAEAVSRESARQQVLRNLNSRVKN